MINGDLNEFVNIIHYGGELFFLYKGKKYILQGWSQGQYHTLVLDYIVENAENDIFPHAYLWEMQSLEMSECATHFLDATIWDGLNFWQVEHEIEWVDC